MILEELTLLLHRHTTTVITLMRWLVITIAPLSWYSSNNKRNENKRDRISDDSTDFFVPSPLCDPVHKLRVYTEFHFFLFSCLCSLSHSFIRTLSLADDQYVLNDASIYECNVITAEKSNFFLYHYYTTIYCSFGDHLMRINGIKREHACALTVTSFQLTYNISYIYMIIFFTVIK